MIKCTERRERKIESTCSLSFMICSNKEKKKFTLTKSHFDLSESKFAHEIRQEIDQDHFYD